MDNSNLTFWLLLLGVGVICFLIGYFLRGAGGSGGNADEISTLKKKLDALEGDLSACRQELEQTKSGQSNQLQPTVFDYKAAKSVFKKTIKQDDLKVIEGIGPKIESLFHNYDIKTWEALARTSVAKCHEVLESGGDRFRVHDPASWPMQARMCSENKWKELYRWQEEHKHGKL